MNNQITTIQSPGYAYIQTPKFLLTDPRYANLPMHLISLYSILYDRYRLSMKNNKNKAWEDENGIYIIYPRGSLAATMHCSKRTIIRHMQKLKLFGLIKERQVGCNKANRIYVTVPEELAKDQTKIYISDKKIPKTPEQQNSNVSPTPPPAVFFDEEVSPQEVPIVSSQEVTNMHASKKDFKKNNPKIASASAESIYQSMSTDWIDRYDKRNRAQYHISKENVKKQICYEALISDAKDSSLVESIVHIITQVYTSNKQNIILSKEESLPISFVIERLKSLTQFHVEYVMDCFLSITHKIFAVDKYLLKSLYNAPITMDPYYTNQILANENAILNQNSSLSIESNWKNDTSHMENSDIIATEEGVVAEIKTQLDFDKFAYDWPSSLSIAEDIVQAMKKMYCSGYKTLRIRGCAYPIELVRKTIRSLTHEHLIYLRDVIRETEGIEYWDAFMRSKIFFASEECDQYYHERYSPKGIHFEGERKYTERYLNSLFERFDYDDDIFTNIGA